MRQGNTHTQDPHVVQTGYVVDLHQDNQKICMAGRLETEETFMCVFDFPRDTFYIRACDVSRIEKEENLILQSTDLSTLDGESVYKIIPKKPQHQWQELHENGISTYEADFSPSAKFQIEKGIKRLVGISGDWVIGDEVDRLYHNPNIQSIEGNPWSPGLKVLSLDIETTDRQEVTTIALIVYSIENQKADSKQVLTTFQSSGEHVKVFDDESALLQQFLISCQMADPDIVMGWNVVEFDLRVLKDRFEAHNLPFKIGRSKKRSWISTEGGWGRNVALVHGRQVVDAMTLVRRSPKGYDDYSLVTVAKTVLGKSKLIASGMEELAEVQKSDPDQFLAYCLEDAQLTKEIVDQEKLLQLALRRSVVTGLPLGRSDGSVAAFDLMYGLGLRSKGLVSPSSGVDKSNTGGAPGGLVLSAKPGLYRDVMVFDFKSLYPSIMMTFNIDPLSFVMAQNDPDGNHVQAPNGAKFSRADGVLPGILQELWENRDKAKQGNDEIGSHSYKITLNAFYGVLAGPCRFANPKIAGAITEFGHYMLRWTKDAIENSWGNDTFEVLYGDTDSLFVRSGGTGDVVEIGNALCSMINDRLQKHVKERYDVHCRLELEFEKAYSRCYIPYTRGKDRGRAKGYAGVIIGESDEPEIVGMEAVRRDWTDLAHDLQTDLLKMIFSDQPREKIEDFIWQEVCAVTDGRRDEKLVYRKRLRKEVSRYTKNIPPHVKAAVHGGIKEGLVRYVITVDGPELADGRPGLIDYKHYIDKQITPIVDSISAVFPINKRSALQGERELFKLES